MMKISRFLKLISENDLGGHLGFAGRPDDSGIRGKGAKREPYPRASGFPYDRPVTYGDPSSFDKDGGSSGGLHGPLVPKDDEHFSLNILDLEELVREIMGSPILLSRGGAPQGGSTIPGVSAWANNPPKDWDAGDNRFDPEPISAWDVPIADASYMRGQTDDELENRLDRIWGMDGNPNMVDPKSFGDREKHTIGSDPFSSAAGHLKAYGVFGLFPDESAWDRVSSWSNSRGSDPSSFVPSYTGGDLL